MKVVLFCGGMGMRLREYTEYVPKPMIPIGKRPILWHLMKYYAHFGHKDFILCLGYRGEVIKDFFLNYDECVSNDFILSEGGQKLELMMSDIHDWTITFAETGLAASIGERFKAVEKYLDGDRVFLANYADALTDLPLPDQIEHFRRNDKTASMLSVRPNLSYHHIRTNGDGELEDIIEIRHSDMRVNGGFFIFKREIFDYIHEGEDLMAEPFRRLIDTGECITYHYDGFWQAVDTAKDKAQVDELHLRGDSPWEVWKDDTDTIVSPLGRFETPKVSQIG